MQTCCVPMFPLPGLVLFPRTMIPLHIFEPRYVRLVRDALAGDRRIAAANLRRGWEKDYHGAPNVFKTVTVARILNEERLPDDRFNILLEGIERAELIEETTSTPYRVIRAAPLVDVLDDHDRNAVREALRELEGLCAQVAEQVPHLRSSMTNLVNQHLHPGIAADKVGSAVVKDPYERQSLLGERRVLRRLQLVNVQLRTHLARMERARGQRSDA